MCRRRSDHRAKPTSGVLGLTSDGGAIWEGDLSPNDSTTYVTGNSGIGVTLSNSQVAFNPLFASGNGSGGVALNNMAFLELDNSKIISNRSDGLFATSQSLASASLIRSPRTRLTTSK